MTTFCIDMLNALKSQDMRVTKHLLNSKVADFYSGDSKGLGLFGTCERDLQYIIFTELCQSYRLYPEYVGAYSDKQRIDLALWSVTGATYEDDAPDIAIEMKWAGFTQAGELSSRACQSMVNDVLKMKRCNVQNRFFMQCAITESKLPLDDNKRKSNLEKNANEIFYKNQFRNHYLRLSFWGSFETIGNQGQTKYFNLLLWKVCKTD